MLNENYVNILKIRKGDFHDQILEIPLLLSYLYTIMNGYACFQIQNRCVITINEKKMLSRIWGRFKYSYFMKGEILAARQIHSRYRKFLTVHIVLWILWMLSFLVCVL